MIQVPLERKPTFWRLFGICLVSLVSCPDSSWSQAGIDDDFRTFTDKQGREVTARVISISDDRKVLTMAGQGGESYELTIVKLCLDDQQYLKEWLSDRPTMSNFRIRVEIEKVRGKTTERSRSGDDRFETEFPAFKIQIGNLSRSTLKSPVVEYLIAKRDRVETHRVGGRLLARNTFVQDSPPEVIWKEKKLEDLAFNREVEFVTDFVEIDQVYNKGSKPDAEDILIGLILRVRDSWGNLIGEYTSSDPRIVGKEWTAFIPDEGSRVIKTRNLLEMPDLLQQGDVVASDLAPSFAGKSVKISASVTLNEDEPSGVLFQMGGHFRGVAIEIQRGRLSWWVRRLENETNTRVFSVNMPISDLPDDEFLLEVTLDNEEMTLSIDGQEQGTRPSPGLLNQQPRGSFSVGHQVSNPVAPQSSGSNFTGEIRDVRIEVGESQAPPAF